jgi:hypothetical protein
MRKDRKLKNKEGDLLNEKGEMTELMRAREIHSTAEEWLGDRSYSICEISAG